ncbi:MAG: ester cyclase [Candidatus Krumholzibacteriia bacterium]
MIAAAHRPGGPRSLLGPPPVHGRSTAWLTAGDRIVDFWTVEGTHTENLRGLPPTGRPVRFSGVAIDRVAGDLVVEEWVFFDMLGLLRQLGMTVVPADAAK